MSLLGHECRPGSAGTDIELAELEELAIEAKAMPRACLNDGALWAVAKAAALKWTPEHLERVLPAFLAVRDAIVRSEPSRLAIVALDAVDRRLIHGYGHQPARTPIALN